jgi:excinuclease ABC subunit C
MSQRPSLEERAAALPTSSGVYLFKDTRGEVLYVGKAKNLRARVRQYLTGQDTRFKVRYLVAQARDVDGILTDTEKEALILENSLIKEYRPRYNAKLKDNSAFLHLRLDARRDWPRYTLTRTVRDDGARYFGPYPSAQKARDTLAFLERHFPLRTCTDAVMRSRVRPCILHQMHRCVAPCVEGYTDKPTYDGLLQESVLLLEGRNQELIDRLGERMRAAAAALEFERAARLRDLVRTLESIAERQKTADTKLGDRDVWALFRDGFAGCGVVVPVREGLMREPVSFPFDGAIEEDGELLSSWMNGWYDGAFIPREILACTAPPDLEALEEVLGERRGGRVYIKVPQRGEKHELVELARTNAEHRFRRDDDADARRLSALERLAGLLELDEPPYRIECFDNSNILGLHPVAAQVVFVDGQPAKQHYRTYKVKTVVGADDFATMAEILERRFRRGAEEGVFPDLLVVDGGRGQLNAALKVLEDLGLSDQKVIGLAKPRTERRWGDQEAVDKIVLPDRAEPILLNDNDPALNLLRHIRDESHRFAITFHRKQRRKATLTSALDDIPGVGPERRKALLRHFGSVKGLRAATPEQIAGVKGISPKLAAAIAAALKPPGAQEGGP